MSEPPFDIVRCRGLGATLIGANLSVRRAALPLPASGEREQTPTHSYVSANGGDPLVAQSAHPGNSRGTTSVASTLSLC